MSNNNTIQIKTSDIKKVYNVEMDGRAWQMKSPGAGDELRMGQMQRRIKRLTAKVDNDTATDSDYDDLDKLENDMLGFFDKLFTDTTPDNSEVKEWVRNTPIHVLVKAVEMIKEQSEAKEVNKQNEQTGNAS